jgi:hypothetical protein
LQMYVPYSPSYGGTGMQVRFGNYDVSGGNSWTSWKTLLASDNYNSYAPTLTGTGASGTWSISVTGNAATATTLQTARTINGVSFNGSANITVAANTTNTLTRGTYLTGSNFNGSAATTWAVDATSANTASKVVARDASGNFAAGTITAALSGNATTSSSTTGNAATATTLQTARTINGVSFDGSADITVADATKLPLTGGTLTGGLTGTTSSFTTFSAAAGTLASPSFTWSTDLNTGIYLNAADRIGFSAGGNDEFRIYTTYTISFGSSRAPIFYDSNNTTYYIDPSSTTTSGFLAGTLVCKNVDEGVYSAGSSLNPNLGAIQYRTIFSNTAFFDSVDSGESMTLRLTMSGGTYTVSWPTNMTWITPAGNVAPTLNGTNDVLVFWKILTSLYGAYVGHGG